MIIKLKEIVYLLSVLALILTSCTSSKKVVYLNDLSLQDSAVLNSAQNAFETPIQKNDQLWISVGGSNPLDLGILNSANGVLAGSAGAISGGNNAILGYLVEADGKIQIPYIGKIQAEGLTRLQLETTLTELFKEYTKNPVVNVRFLNYTFTVLGEVGRPGKFSMSTERTSILEAISMAGDITYLGKSNNVLLIREQNGKRTIARLNLLSKDIFNSSYFYLKTNDVIYVEPVKAKFISRAGLPQYLGIATLGLTLILTFITLSKK